MASYFWHRGAGEKDTWREALSSHRDQVIAEHKPAFVTVLDVDSVPSEDWDMERYAKMKYSGPFYVDFDAESLEDAITQFNKFLDKLEELSLDLNACRLYATGGRGFHVEVPMSVFVPKIPKDGFALLPYIYREMAMDMVVDTMDLRVYTARRGRMWRTCGVQRDNGLYKVPVSTAQARVMTTEMYAEICSAPRPAIEAAQVEVNIGLATVFSKSKDKLEGLIKSRGKSYEANKALVAKFNGEFPDSILRIMRGEGLAPGIGFQKLSMQLAITANALGKSAKDLVDACEGLCKNHSGDSSRYGSPKKRKDELRRMWEYTHDNPCYSFSPGGIKSLMAPGEPSPDLETGMASSVGKGGLTRENMTEEQLRDEAQGEKSLMEGLLFYPAGIFKSSQEGSKRICNAAFANPILMREAIPDAAGHHTLLGVQAELIRDLKPCGRQELPDKCFLSRTSMTTHLSGFGGIYSGSDTQAGVVKLHLQNEAEERDSVIYALHKIGLDCVQDPAVSGRVKKDIVWVTADKILSAGAETQYVYKPFMGTLPAFPVDVHKVPQIERTTDTIAWVRALTKINTPMVMAQMLGWFVSCFHKQFYQEAFQQFPLLHPNGPAGSGKSMTSLLMGRLYYASSEPKMLSCGGMTTVFALKDAMTSSCSVPLILDEYKPTEMDTHRTNFLMQAFRLAYNQGKGASGAMGNASAASTFRDIAEFSFSAPLVFLAEAQETQTAIVQRSIPVSFNAAELEKRKDDWDLVQAGKDHMSSLGKLILKASFEETTEKRRDALTPIIKNLRSVYGIRVHDRQVYNMAVVLEGLNYLDTCLESVFGDELKPEMAMLKSTIYEHKAELNISAQSEAAKLFNDISLMSRELERDHEFAIREGFEYVVMDGYIDVLMRETFVKYYGWARRMSMVPYYASTEAFIKAMGTFPPLADKVCANSPLRKNGQARIFRFNLEKLMSEGVEMFETKS